MVGPWKSKVYDMHHVVVSVKSRQVPGAMTDEEFLSTCNDNDTESEGLDDILTEEERKQLENALKMESPDHAQHVPRRHSCCEPRPMAVDDVGSSSNSESRQDRKSWFGNWKKRGGNHKQEGQKKVVPPRSSLCVEEKVSDLLGDSPSRCQSRPARHSIEIVNSNRADDLRRGRDRDSKRTVTSLENGYRRKESEYQKGLRPVLWLSSDFPLRTEELLPLLDILANKVKAIRRLRDLLTTKLPAGAFPVKVWDTDRTIVPTIRVLVTFTKFEELQPLEEFSTPPSSPESNSPETLTSSSWIQWIKAPYRQGYSATSGPSSRVEDIQDPFVIPPDYIWTTPEAKKKKIQENKGKSKKGKGQNQ
ncbi:hypothetical protein GW17_00057704 [Ensete ventricosum]|nr:hypothetical protein GW17_00057704 [Ensete ventricosum]